MTTLRGAVDAAVLAGFACLAPICVSAQPADSAADHPPPALSHPGQPGSAASGGAARNEQPPATAAPGSAAPTTAARTNGSRGAVARRSMLPLVQPLWSELSPSQQQILEPFASQWNAWPSVEKQSWVALADKVPRMKPEEQARTQQRINEWAALTPEQRRVARLNYRLARRLPPDERKAQWERYTELTPEQRAVLRTSGWTSNTAARHAGAPTGLAKDAAQPFVPQPLRTRNPQ